MIAPPVTVVVRHNSPRARRIRWEQARGLRPRPNGSTVKDVRAGREKGHHNF